jgi:hypothetical protein
MKSKPNTRKVMARARNLEIYSNRSKGRAKAWEGRCTGSSPARAGTGLSFRSNLSKVGVSPSFPELASRSIAPFAPRPGDLA